jgi:vancomycin resistance protein YoaR
VVVVVGAGAAWAWDLDRREGEVLRNVQVAGRPLGGAGPERLDATLEELAAEYERTTVRIETPDGDLEASGAEVGLTLDAQASRALALAEGRDGAVPARFGAWLASFVVPRTAELAVTVDEGAVRALVAERDPTGRVAPTEPDLEVVDGDLVVVPGEHGRGLDAGDVAADIEERAADGRAPIVVRAEAATLPPRFSEADAERLAERGRALAAEPLPVQAGGTPADVPPATLLGWLSAEGGGDGLELAVERERAVADLEALLPDAGTPAVNAGFQVEDGQVVVVPGADGTRCCAAEAADAAFAALLDRPQGAVELPLAPVPPGRTTEDAQALGIVEPIASFTTSFAPGQSRVVNIHRIADLTRGVVIDPGGDFSVNGYVGRRTAAKGFVSGGVIQDGVFDESIGGGISQYATALFNAAFFGGLEFGTYQSHSIYIPRYPYGREATLSFPQPDLIIENPTPYGVLLWPTYTSSSLTMTLYSTPWATGRQTGQRESPVGECTRVTTERTRTFVSDGRTEVDTVHAVYRPAEGVDC